MSERLKTWEKRERYPTHWEYPKLKELTCFDSQHKTVEMHNFINIVESAVLVSPVRVVRGVRTCIDIYS